MSGKAIISLLFEDGDYNESGNIILMCDQAGFKALLESLIIESRKHITIPEKQPEFICLECGHKFYSAHAAEAAAFGDGCPSCSGSDIEVA
jgi:Zn finger protein HypA/HybF involved in hydrogenase expression